MKYTYWSEFALYCEQSGRDCGNCEVPKITELEPFNPKKQGYLNYCQMPWSVKALKNEEVTKVDLEAEKKVLHKLNTDKMNFSIRI